MRVTGRHGQGSIETTDDAMGLKPSQASSPACSTSLRGRQAAGPAVSWAAGVEQPYAKLRAMPDAKRGGKRSVGGLVRESNGCI